MKPTISRAMATLTTLAVLPRALSRRNRVQSQSLRSPGDIANDFWQRLDPIDLMTTDARLHSVSPGAFDQRASGMGVAAMLSHARACARAAAENLEDADGLCSRFVARHSADGSNRAWLRDRHQGPRRASTRRLGEDALAWWRHDDWSSPDRRAWSESMPAPLHRSDGRG